MADLPPQGFPKLDIKAARALRPNTHQIRIQSVLGGMSPASDFGKADQFFTSRSVDPGQPIDPLNGYSYKASGQLVPTPLTAIGTITGTANWMRSHPKANGFYIYDSTGSTYSSDFSTITALSDAGAMTGGAGNGMEYYDNYMYFAKGTDVARYGPLNGVPAFTASYWVGSLSLAALTNTTYPSVQFPIGLKLPNHPMYRHSDGKLYFGDVSGNQGIINVISTSKTTVEGDTNSGSKYAALTFGYGLWPTALGGYGQNLVVALAENNSSGSDMTKNGTAKIGFWDTTSGSFNQIIWEEFPDEIITAIKNINGVLYFFSTNVGSYGIRVTQYIGGYSIKEIAYIENGLSTLPDGVTGTAQRLLFGSSNTDGSKPVNGITNYAAVYSLGLQKASLGNGLFTPMGGPSGTTVTSLMLPANSLYQDTPIMATSDSLSAVNTVYKQNSSGDYSLGAPLFWSQKFRIGQPFKITKIRVQMFPAINANSAIVPKIYFDDGDNTKTLTTINNANYAGKRSVVIRPENATGDRNFWLELAWTGTGSLTVTLPITIEYELIDD